MKTITLWETSKQRKSSFQSDAKTLGDLEGELNERGISLDDYDIFEGVSHTKLMSRESILPTNIPFKGTTTDNLMLFVTLKNKKISSGVTDRKALGAFIKENNLGDEVKKLFGRNWTQVKTDDLVSFVESHKGKTPVKDSEKAPKKAPAKKEAVKKVVEVEDAGGVGDLLFEPVKIIMKNILSGLKTLVEAHNRLVNDLYESDYIEDSDDFKVNIELPEGDGIVPEEKEEKLEEEEEKPKEVEGTFADSDMKDMANSMGF